MDLAQGSNLHLCNPLLSSFAQAQRILKELAKELCAKRLCKQDMHKFRMHFLTGESSGCLFYKDKSTSEFSYSG